jgi:hypothetical protein
MIKLATVEYQIATYSGSVEVPAYPNDDNDILIARAKAQLRRQTGPLPLGSQSFKVRR